MIMQESTKRLETMLYNAILAWYDDSVNEYHGLDDEEFAERVCRLTGLSGKEYKNLINGNTGDYDWSL